MPQGQRVRDEVLVLSCVGCSTLEEVAEKSGLAVSTVYTRTKRLRDQGVSSLPTFEQPKPVVKNPADLNKLFAEKQAEWEAENLEEEEEEVAPPPAKKKVLVKK